MSDLEERIRKGGRREEELQRALDAATAKLDGSITSQLGELNTLRIQVGN